MRSRGAQYPEGWCSSANAVGCKFPVPVLDGEEQGIFDVFYRCRTQIQYRPLGMDASVPYGFNYAGCEKVLASRGYSLDDPDFLDTFQGMESEYVDGLIARIRKSK